jgi:hypothetical protein
MKLIAASIFLFLASVCKGQINIINQSLTDSTLNILYIGVDNRIKVTGYNDSYNLTITGGGGSLYKTGKNEYIVHSSTPTMLCELVILKGTKHIFRKSYEVRTISTPIATTCGLKDTTVKAGDLLVNPFVSVFTPGCYLRLNYRIISFHATFIQDTDSTITISKSNMFSTEQIQMIKILKPGDKIYFDDLRYIGPNDARNLPPLPFWIKIK